MKLSEVIEKYSDETKVKRKNCVFLYDVKTLKNMNEWYIYSRKLFYLHPGQDVCAFMDENYEGWDLINK